jgi:hypothetical protein
MFMGGAGRKNLWGPNAEYGWNLLIWWQSPRFHNATTDLKLGGSKLVKASCLLKTQVHHHSKSLITATNFRSCIVLAANGSENLHVELRGGETPRKVEVHTQHMLWKFVNRDDERRSQLCVKCSCCWPIMMRSTLLDNNICFTANEAQRVWTLEAISCAKRMEFEQISLLHQSTNSSLLR